MHPMPHWGALPGPSESKGPLLSYCMRYQTRKRLTSESGRVGARSARGECLAGAQDRAAVVERATETVRGDFGHGGRGECLGRFEFRRVGDGILTDPVAVAQALDRGRVDQHVVPIQPRVERDAVARRPWAPRVDEGRLDRVEDVVAQPLV